MKSLRLAALLWAALASPALAHAVLLLSNPAPHSIVAAPASIELTFGEEITDNARIGLMHDGVPVRLGQPVLAPNHSVLTAAVMQPLAAGTYVVNWQNIDRDEGHRMTGSFSFSVK